MTERRVLQLAAAVAALTVAVGLGVRPFGHTMGTALSPFVMAWLPRADPWALVALPVLAAVVALVPRLLAARRFPPLVAATAAVAGLAVNAIPLGPHGWDVVLDLGPSGSFEAKNEYLPALGALRHGAHFFLDRFAELVPALPNNVGGHPPGPVLFLNATGLTTAPRMAALCVVAVAALAPLTYALARSLGLGEQRARTAGVLAALTPGLLLFGISSADAVYAALGAAAAALLVSRRHRAAGVAMFTLASFAAWSLLAIGFFAAVVVLRREGLRPALVLATACGAAVLALNGLLALTTGYDPVGTLRATSLLYDHSLARIRPYAFWWIGSPVAWALMLGPPLAAGWLVAARRGDAAALALGAVIVIAAVAGFTKAETERIWLPFVPLACAAAATVIETTRMRRVAAALVLQGVVVSLLSQTIW